MTHRPLATVLLLPVLLSGCVFDFFIGDFPSIPDAGRRPGSEGEGEGEGEGEQSDAGVPDAGFEGEGETDGGVEGEGEADGGVVGEGEGEGESVPGGPVVESVEVLQGTLSPGIAVTLRVHITDPDGTDDISDGRLVAASLPLQLGGDVYAWLTEEAPGSYIASLDWSQATAVAPLNFPASGGTLLLRVQVQDNSGHLGSSNTIPIALSCGPDPLEACDSNCGTHRCGDVCAYEGGSFSDTATVLCDGVCTQLDTDAHCGMCTTACTGDTSCTDTHLSDLPFTRYQCSAPFFGGCGLLNCVDGSDVCLNSACTAADAFMLAEPHFDNGEGQLYTPQLVVDGTPLNICSGLTDLEARSICRGFGLTGGHVGPFTAVLGAAVNADCTDAHGVARECLYQDAFCDTAPQIVCDEPVNDDAWWCTDVDGYDQEGTVISRSGNFSGLDDTTGHCIYASTGGPDMSWMWRPSRTGPAHVELTSDEPLASVAVMRGGCTADETTVPQAPAFISDCSLFGSQTSFDIDTVEGELLQIFVDSPQGTTSGAFSVTITRP